MTVTDATAMTVEPNCKKRITRNRKHVEGAIKNGKGWEPLSVRLSLETENFVRQARRQGYLVGNSSSFYGPRNKNDRPCLYALLRLSKSGRRLSLAREII